MFTISNILVEAALQRVFRFIVVSSLPATQPHYSHLSLSSIGASVVNYVVIMPACHSSRAGSLYVTCGLDGEETRKYL